MKIDIRDLQNLLKDISVQVHIHDDRGSGDGVITIELLNQLLSRSTSKLQHALARAGHSLPQVIALSPEKKLMKTALDQALTELIATVSAQTTVIDSAIAYIDVVPDLIQQAYDAGIASGVKPEQLGALSGLIENMKAKSAGLKAALAENTPPVIPPAPVSVPLTLVPTSGFDGTTIVIGGAAFGADKGSVTLSGAPCEIISWSDTSITTTVPVGASPGPTDVTVDVVVTPVTGAAQTAQFTVTPDPNV